MAATLGTLSFAGGLALGLASSLHCASMCGGLASTLMFAFSPADDRGARARALLLAQAGRASGYVLAGAIAAGAGGSLIGAFAYADAFVVLRVAAAATIVWIGLSTIGLAPPPSGLDRAFAGVASRLRPARSGRATTIGAGAPFLAGLGWSVAPCGIALGAIVYAGLSGSALDGAIVMAGFALGTMPSVIASAYGIGRLRELARAPRLKTAAGLSLILVGVATAFAGTALDVLCFG